MKSWRCFQHIDWFPDSAGLRRFAASMLMGFAVIGGILWLRTHSLGKPTVLFAIGLTLALAAIIPGIGRLAYLAVYLPTSLLGFVISQVLLTLIFFLVVTPLALILRWMGKDLLQTRSSYKSMWIEHPRTKDRKSYYR